MPVPELVKFREKYPDYGDMSDADLATKLAQKYPDDYGDLPGKVQGQSGSSSEMTDAEFTRERQRSATQDPTFQNFARATIPTAAAAASFIPGLQGLGAQTLLGAGGTMLNQMAGLEEPSLGNVAVSAAIPTLAAGAVRLGKAGFKGIAELVAPGPLKEAGVSAGAERMGVNPYAAERIFSTPASEAAFMAARSAGPVPADEISRTVNATIGKLQGLSNPPRPAVKYLQNMANKFQPGTTADYGDVIDELQLLKNNADSAISSGNIPTGRELYKVRGDILDTLDSVSPAIKRANAIYKREESTKEIVKALRASNAGNKIRDVFENNSLIRSSFSKEEFKDLEHLAVEITDVPSAGAVGLGRAALMALTEPIAQALVTKPGRYLMRKVMEPTGKLTDVGAATVAQFMRAYVASGADMEDTGKSTDIDLPIKMADKTVTAAMRDITVPLEQKIQAAAARAEVTKDVERAKQAIKAGASIGAQVRP